MKEYCATGVPRPDRAAYWARSVTETLFPLSAEIREPAAFDGRLRRWEMGSLSLSHFLTGGISYRRERHHLRRLGEEEVLVSFSLRSETRFDQNALSLRFGREEFIIQRGGMPYEFGHADANELLVLKVRAEDLARHVRALDRFAPLVFDASRGVGRLLLDTVWAMPERLAQTDERVHARLGGNLLELLGLALEADERVLASGETTVRQAHVGRIELFIRRNLHRPSLSPEVVAAGCGISVRYLHELFSQRGQSVGSWIRELRLHAAREQLCDPSRRETIAEAAYRWGFGDQAQFSRLYKAQFGETPRETKRSHAPAGERDAADGSRQH
jgi:AraC-like DNA-binding protein